MNILYCCDAEFPGRAAHTVHIMRMCDAFEKHGNKVTLFMKKKSNSIQDEEIFEYYGVDNKFELWIKEKTESLFSKVGFIGKWLRQVKNRSFDLIYGRSIWFCATGCLFTDINVIFETHNKILKSSIFGKLLKMLITRQNFKRLVVISKTLQEYYINEYGVERDKVFVAHDGADEVDFSTVKNTYDIDLNKKNIGYIGSLHDGRGIDVILKIAENLQNYCFHIVGGGNDDIKKWKEKYDYENVKFYGHIPPVEVKDIGCFMDVLLAPYQKAVWLGKEGETANTVDFMSPMKIFEYMSFGKPIVCSKLPACEEILENEKTAILCNAESVDEWCAAITAMCENNEIASEVGNAALNELRENYTWYKRAEKVIE